MIHGNLLDEREPPAFDVVDGDAQSPFVILCDHAGRRLPRALGSLGLTEADLERHIAWDIGAEGLARELAKLLGAWLILQRYSRLVIDCNRPLTSPDSIARQSEDTTIPGNLAVSSEQAALRAQQIFDPYHARIRSELDRRAALGTQSVLLLIHTFTPIYRGVPRPWQVGVLHHHDARIARPLLAALRNEGDLNVGDNQPYAAGALTDYSLIEHAERRGLPYVELEVRQDLVGDARGQRVWAERLARLLNTSSVFPA